MKAGFLNISGMAVTLLCVPIVLGAQGASTMEASEAWLAEHRGSDWIGASELWVDPSGNDGELSDATLHIGDDGIAYTWLYRGEPQQGVLRRQVGGLLWQDSWHQPEGVLLAPVRGHGSIYAAEYSYAAGEGPDWHWRIKLAERPDGSLVLQMINIAPWGEETRAVRTVVRRSR
jgi:hypothetical protein